MTKQPDKQYATLSDTALMEHIGNGGLDAFAELVKRYQKPLLNFFLKLGVEQDAEDLVQKTFLKIYASRDSYRPCSRVLTFLFCVARNLWIDWLRSKCRRENMMREYSERMASVNPSQKPLESFLDVKSAIAALPPQLRLVITLTIYHGLTYREAAQVLNVPIGTVKSRMHAAIAKLRELLLYADTVEQRK